MHQYPPKLVILGRDGILNLYRDDTSRRRKKAAGAGCVAGGGAAEPGRLACVLATTQSGIGRGRLTWRR